MCEPYREIDRRIVPANHGWWVAGWAGHESGAWYDRRNV